MNKDTYSIGGHEFESRFILGSGKCFGAEDIRKNEKMGNKTSHNGNCDMYNTRGNID